MHFPRLLMLTHRFVYPPNRGDRIRSYNLLRVLSDHYRITLACTADEPVSTADRSHVDTFCESVIVAPLSRGGRLLAAATSAGRGCSLTAGMFHHSGLQKSIESEQRSNPFDAVLVFCSSMFPYVDNPLFKDTRMIVDLVDVDSAKWSQMGQESTWIKRPIYRFEANRVRQLEQRIADRADAVVLVSDREADLFRRCVNTNTPIIGVSNGVDTDFFVPRHPNAADPKRKRSVKSEVKSVKPEQSCSSFTLHSSPFKLLFTGVLDYAPNVEGIDWFCRQVLPTLNASPTSSEQVGVQASAAQEQAATQASAAQEQAATQASAAQEQAATQPSAVPLTPSLPHSTTPHLPFTLTIVGRRPNAKVQDLATLPGVNLVGEVPDVRPYLHGADIAISPLKLARGIQNKVLEAMASELPVVLTTQSAEGIDAISSQHFVIANTVDQWHTAITELANNKDVRTRMAQAARDLVVNEYSWPARLSEFVKLLSK
ncbi:glycosyltransferase [Novipirellula artificiosorum]|uniref:Glycosyl transferases group 1 n=1 Tax=Novipirellula artificiosorum TaxID=2528016 RepID=A0A5C6CYZ1_9BACT|nr:glycosyltransferase [Novipirellula artificiosorum]TWU29135.1 Glycosyl transferases group 1 [Novipirellula artificiosorum]